MPWHNNGITQDEVLQNQFSAYVKRAVYHRRLRYLMQNSKRENYETDMNDLDNILPDPKDHLQNYVELDTLRRALQNIKEKERQVVLAHVVDEKSFVEIAVELDMTYKAVTCLYYRVMRKLRNAIEGGDPL